MVTEASPQTALACAIQGDFRRFEEVLGRISAGTSAEERAWTLALRAVRWHSEPDRSELPDHQALEALIEASTPARHAASMACVFLEKAAVLRFDRRALASWIDLHRRLARTDAAGDPGLWLEAAQLWLLLLGGATRGLDDAAVDLETRSARRGLAPLVIESASLRALALLSAGAPDQATEVARRASRMARTEALPQWEYLAHLVLARVRRFTDKPLMATRILSALGEIAPPTWYGWLSWEILLAGGRPTSRDLIARLGAESQTHAARAALELDLLLSAARSGAREDFHATAVRLRGLVADFADLARELEDLLVALDPSADLARANPSLRAWIAGESMTMPSGFAGLGAPLTGEHPSGPSAGAWVIAGPDGAARRVVSCGLPLTPGAERATRPPQTRRRSAREDTALATLALAGPSGLEVESLFKEIYGFAYVAELHEGVFRVLLHRVSSRLGDGGHVSWTAGRVLLRHDGLLITADPRCALRADSRVLLLLAKRGRTTARATARDLGMPLRTVQAALKELTVEGACRVEKQGRAVHYIVEDTTFSEPTKY